MGDARSVTLQAALDDWISDYEMQGAYEHECSLEPSKAFAVMVPQALDWIGRGVLVPGDMREQGFVAWVGDAEGNAQRFADIASRRTVVTVHGQLCWFETGPEAEGELTRIRG
jgi:hypothetical protein